MTPTLFGRIQTRLFVLAVIGGLWTLIVTPFLPNLRDAPNDIRYELTFTVLATVAVLGLAWEVVYHVLQQFRWEKDWPTLFGLVTGINEGVVAFIALRAGLAPNGGVVGAALEEIPVATFLWHFTTTWLITFLFVNGPMRVVSLNWRFRGGRLL